MGNNDPRGRSPMSFIPPHPSPNRYYSTQSRRLAELGRHFRRNTIISLSSTHAHTFFFSFDVVLEPPTTPLSSRNVLPFL